MAAINLKREVEKDIKRYSSILERYNAGRLKTQNLEGREDLIEMNSQIVRHLENIIRELQALLRDG